MRKIVPGGYYSYDAAGKKIWLDYSYYGIGLENVDRIRNLSKNLDLYSSSGAGKPITVSSGCITHSYQGTEADTDKIQVTLRTPIPNSLTELTPVDGVVTLSTDGKVLVLPTANSAILPSFNQSVLNSNLLTIAESPFGGLKGSGSPDYAPGTLFCQTDGIYLTDTSGTNSTKTLTAGKLQELNLLTVNTTAHTLETIFQVENTATSNNPTVIDNCDSPTNWTFLNGSGVISSENGRLKVVGTPASGSLIIRNLSHNFNASTFKFLFLDLQSSHIGNKHLFFGNDSSNYIKWDGSISSTANLRYVLPLLCPAAASPSAPATRIGTVDYTDIDDTRIGFTSLPAETVTFYIDNITADTAKSAYIELQTPDNLSDSSITLQAWDGSAYQTTGTYKLDSTYSAVGTPTSANWKLSDGTKFDDCYGSGNGRALFPKGSASETKAGSSGNITYSANKGTSKRIGFRVDLPPSDGGRTNFNKCRMKAIISYTDTVGNVVPDLSGNNNTGTIVGGVTKLNDGGLLFDGSTGYVDCGNVLDLNSSDPFSFFAHFKDTSLALSFHSLVSKQTQSYPYTGYSIGIAGSLSRVVELNIIKTYTTDSLIVRGSTSINTGYNRIVLTYDGSKKASGFKLYINGALDTISVGQDTLSSLLSTNYNFEIGARNGFYFPFTGEIIECIVYNDALAELDAINLSSGGQISASGISAHWKQNVSNMGSTTHDFSDSTNTSYGLQNLSKPWIALYDPADSLIDFYLFTHRPQNLSFKRNESGVIYELSLYPGAGSVYHGQITFSGLTTDTDSDLIPDCLEENVNGSVTKFLQNYTMVI